MRLAAILLISFLYMININAQVISTNKLWGLYYGYPSQVNGAASLPEAKNIWKKFKREIRITNPDMSNTTII